MKITIYSVFFSISLFFCSQAQAAVTCDRGKIKNVFVTFPKNEQAQVNIYFSDGRGGVWKKVPYHITEAGLDRLFSAAMAYKVANRSVKVSYPDLSSCSQISVSGTDATFTGIWLD